MSSTEIRVPRSIHLLINCPIQSQLQSLLGVRSFYIECNEQDNQPYVNEQDTQQCKWIKQDTQFIPYLIVVSFLCFGKQLHDIHFVFCFTFLTFLQKEIIKGYNVTQPKWTVKCFLNFLMCVW